MQSTLRQNLRFGATGIAHDGISKVLLWLALAGPIEVFIPSSFPLQNSWRLRVFRNDSGTGVCDDPGLLGAKQFQASCSRA